MITAETLDRWYEAVTHAVPFIAVPHATNPMQSEADTVDKQEALTEVAEEIRAEWLEQVRKETAHG